jgi:hypothetical protein
MNAISWGKRIRKAAVLSLLLGVAGFALPGCYYDNPSYYGRRTVGTAYYASAPAPYYGGYYGAGYPGYGYGPGYGTVAVGISSYGGRGYYPRSRYYRGSRNYRGYRGARYQRTGASQEVRNRNRSARTRQGSAATRRQAQLRAGQVE